ncbi:MAG: beta-propeller fold lactonase family protein [Thermoanaerobaculia bacterium]|nr:MAG: beta-propeller fold lactonase family protein [Thermoanaerobaculia bacterium]
MRFGRIRSTFTLLTVGALGLASVSAAGSLDFVEAEIQADLAGTYDLVLSPDGAHLYAIGDATHSLVALARDGGTGALTFIQSLRDGQGGVDGLRRPRQVAISPDGVSVYVVANQDDAVALFARDAGTGSLSFGGAVFNDPPAVDGLWQAKGVVVSAGGAWVLASGRSDPAAPKGAVAVFSRDLSTGALAFVAVHENGTGGITGLGTGGSLSLSPDGTSLYVTTGGTNTVVVFAFDETTGALSWVETQAGIAGAAEVAFSADGTRAYVAGTNGVAAFARDSGTGALTSLGATMGTPTTPGLAGVAGLALSPDDAFLYTSASIDNAAGALLTVPAGAPLWFDARVDNQGGVDGLAGARGIAVSGDGFVYVGGPGDDAVAVFARGDALDFGDATDPTFPTLLASDGARHGIAPGFYLGSGIDAEADGAPAAAADGDDLAGVDDEDAVVFTGAIVPGEPASADVMVSAAGLLDAWIDFTGDGDWDDAGERIASGAALTAGLNSLAFAAPGTTVPFSTVAARFRLSSAGVAGPGGPAPDGEVEDHVVATGSGADLGVATGGTTVADWSQPFTFTVTVTNGGPNDVVAAAVAVAMSANSGPVLWTCVASGGACTAAGSGDIADTVDLTAGGTLVYTIEGTVPDQAPGPYVTAAASVNVPVGVMDPVASNDAALQQSLIPSIFLDGFETGDSSRWSLALP